MDGTTNGDGKCVVSIDREVLVALANAMASSEWLVTIHGLHNGRITHWFKPSRRFPPIEFGRCADKLREDGYNRLRAVRKHDKKARRQANGK